MAVKGWAATARKNGSRVSATTRYVLSPVGVVQQVRHTSIDRGDLGVNVADVNVD